LKHGKQITINGKDYQQNPENKDKERPI